MYTGGGGVGAGADLAAGFALLLAFGLARFFGLARSLDLPGSFAFFVVYKFNNGLASSVFSQDFYSELLRYRVRVHVIHSLS